MEKLIKNDTYEKKQFFEAQIYQRKKPINNICIEIITTSCPGKLKDYYNI